MQHVSLTSNRCILVFFGHGAPTKQQSLDLKSYLASQWPTFRCQCFQNWQTFADASNSLHSTCKSKWSKVGNETTVRMVQSITIFVKLRTRHLRLNVSQITKHFEMGGSFKKTPKTFKVDQSDYFTASWTTWSQIKAPPWFVRRP